MHPFNSMSNQSRYQLPIRYITPPDNETISRFLSESATYLGLGLFDTGKYQYQIVNNPPSNFSVQSLYKDKSY